MLIVLIVLNIIAVIFAFSFLWLLPNSLRWAFVVGALVPIAISGGILWVGFADVDWGWSWVIQYLFRGGFVMSVLTGGVCCYILSHRNPN